MPEVLFVLKKIATSLILPPVSLLLLALLGLLSMRRWPRFGRALAGGAVLLLLVFCMPCVSTLLANAADTASAANATRAKAAQAIVILGGGRREAPEYGGETVSSATLERIRYGAKLAKERALPVLVTGGSVFEGIAEAELMAQVLRDTFAVEPRWVEARSRDTHQNAVFSAALLKSAGIHTVLLVTHDIHERRGMKEFAAQDIEAIPAPTTSGRRPTAVDFSGWLPSASALQTTSAALHELLGTALVASK